jgi:nucleotide-binding universal stress UspA family protein
MNGSIIVPLDGTRFGEQALPYAFSIARRAGLPLHLVHVHEQLAPVYAAAFASAGDAPDAEISQNEQEYLQALRERTRFDQDIEIETAVIEGDVADALDQYARDVKAALIVMSTDDRGALQRFLLGSVADRLLGSSLPPLLLVHPDNLDSELDVDVHLNHLLLPLESAAQSEGVMTAALALGTLFDGDCTLFHVVDDSPGNEFAQNDSMTGHADLDRESCRNAASAHFENLAEVLREKGHKTNVTIVENPYIAEAVLEEAESGNADWIAISSMRRPRLSQLMFGSTADRIVHGAKVPVLVYFPQRDQEQHFFGEGANVSR